MDNRTIESHDSDFAHHECDEAARKALGQVWTPYEIMAGRV